MKKIVFLAISLFCMQTVLTFTPNQEDSYKTKIGNFIRNKVTLKIITGTVAAATVAAAAVSFTGTGLKAMMGQSSMLDALEEAGGVGFAIGLLSLLAVLAIGDMRSDDYD
ncbi:MAG TPA: hypothetical protein VEK38_02830 [Candidatus Bathyarchaeia archaeon]|nr:hypothetical protein [Candidatus Bathyarchaeia archaeon]